MTPDEYQAHLDAALAPDGPVGRAILAWAESLSAQVDDLAARGMLGVALLPRTVWQFAGVDGR